MVPEALPVVLGAKVAVNVVVWPTASVKGSDTPLMAKPVPLTVAWETVTLAVPEFVKVTVGELLVVPTVTLPKVRLAGEADSVPTDATAVPKADAGHDLDQT